jgi:hypothetical protein
MAIIMEMYKGRMMPRMPEGFEMEHDINRRQFLVRYENIVQTIDEDLVYQMKHEEGFWDHVFRTLLREYDMSKKEESDIVWAVGENVAETLPPEVKRPIIDRNIKKMVRFHEVKVRNNPPPPIPKEAVTYDF